MEKEKKRKQFIRKIKNKYRLVILNDSTFEERFSFRLSPLNLFLLGITAALLIIVLVTLTIVYTPIRESIPGYTDVSLRQDLTRMVLKSDSLEQELKRNKIYLNNISAILKGEKPESHTSDSIIEAVETQSNPMIKSKEDSLLRDYVEREESYSLVESDNGENGSTEQLFFFPPLLGSLTGEFDESKDHFGVDIVAPKDEAIKATLPGTIIFAEWTVETGYVIQVQHQDNLTSIYKHNSVLLKKTGDKVNAGEAIAIIGNTGHLSTGPHLHFELWQDGVALNPVEYINFE